MPGAAEQLLWGELVEFDQACAVGIIVAAAAGVFSGDADQAYGFALQGGFDLLAQVGLWFIQFDPHFQPGLALQVGEQVDIRQFGQLRKDLRQRQRADTLQVDGAGDQA